MVRNPQSSARAARAGYERNGRLCLPSRPVPRAGAFLVPGPAAFGNRREALGAPRCALNRRRAMVNPEKEAAVAELAESFRESNGAVLTEYRGLTVKQLQDLRRALGGSATYAVAKNTLTKIAAKQADVELPAELLTGPTAIAFITGDVVEAAKGLRDFAK